MLEGCELYLETIVVRMIFCNSVSSLFFEIGNYHASENFEDAAVPRLCCFHRRVEDFRLRVAVYTMLYSYTYAKPSCMSRPYFTVAL